MDFYYSFVTGGRVQGSASLWFQSSKLGYLSSGRVSTSDQRTEKVAVMFIKTHADPSPTDPPVVDLTKYWELEEIGMKESLEHGAADEEAVTTFSSSVKFQNGRYQVCCPWETPSEELKDNYGVAYGRLRSLLARFSQSDGLAQSYSDVFKSQLETGILEKVLLSSRGSNVYYMPHHGVHRPNQSTAKLRVVFDASSKARKGIASLNDCLHRGPVLLEDLCGLLLRFRTNFVGLVSDIEKAFLQIGLQESERDVTRLLWVNEIGLPPVRENLVAYRFCRVPFGVISSPFLLGATVAHHLRKNSSPVANKMLQNIYVDNVITGESSPEAAIDHYQAAKQILQSASMNLRQWYTNSDIVRNSIHANDQGEDLEPKVLELRWNTASYNLRLTTTRLGDVDSHLTKRILLKRLHRVFEPCGFVAPVLITGKLLLQDLWTLGLGWDEPVPEELSKRWHREFMPNLRTLHNVHVPRYIMRPDATNVQLHVFCDVSTRACAAVVYIRQEQATVPGNIDLLFAKSRLAPIKQKMTIPRLELVALVLGARLLQFVKSQIGVAIDQSFIWTDSQCVLHWLRSQHALPRFVENRINELRKLTNVVFRYVPSENNPADMPTRDCAVETLLGSKLWWHGSDFLKASYHDWPVNPAPQEPDTSMPQTNDIATNFEAVAAPTHLIDETRYGSLLRLLRVTAYVFRFVQNVRKNPSERLTSYLLPEEIDSSLSYWIFSAEKNCRDLILCLTKKHISWDFFETKGMLFAVTVASN